MRSGDDGVLGPVKFLHPLDLDPLGACAGDFGPHGDQEVGEVHDLRFLGGSLDDSRPLGKDGGHHDVSRAQDGRAVSAAEINPGSDESRSLK